VPVAKTLFDSATTNSVVMNRTVDHSGLAVAWSNHQRLIVFGAVLPWVFIRESCMAPFRRRLSRGFA